MRYQLLARVVAAVADSGVATVAEGEVLCNLRFF
ncbi:hypothetical protein BVRB_7g157150 [Beta vulgaris subsp. vulgaris]|nr:hypothetical protein BVRB_7g157150 [Beta vulgaris subsp. vulgaris]